MIYFDREGLAFFFKEEIKAHLFGINWDLEGGTSIFFFPTSILQANIIKFEDFGKKLLEVFPPNVGSLRALGENKGQIAEFMADISDYK